MAKARIEVSEEINQKLDKIKSEHYQINGKGHTETLAFLIRHYEQTESIEQLIKDEFSGITETIERSVSESFKKFLRNLFSFATSG